MAFLHPWLLFLSLAPVALGYPYSPPTCYTKVLTMAKELVEQAAWLKSDPQTSHCMANVPDLYIDVHNECVMVKMRTYISMVDSLRARRCSYTREVRSLGLNVRQLYIIMSQKCHGDLVFTVADCAALERPPARRYGK